ncbi:hypothetical protein QJQ45_025810 [Haematococcus lacustris]|nr:hypothetical protein QJQ45_025810 [Haematococcus lacustris]
MSTSAVGTGSLLSNLYAWGGSVVQYAAEQMNNFLGWEELDVVDPEAEKAGKGSDKPDAGLHQEERKQAWGTKQFQQYIGMDVTSLLSVPVWIMEPFTILQKAAEIMEYTDLLDKADQCENPHERFAWLAAYCVSPFGSAERAWKPFNPILGETFQVEVGNGVQYLAEQVSHHPPVCAAHAENKHFKYDLVSAPTTKFLGNSLEVYPYGRTRITLRSTGEVYTLVPPNAMVHNIVIGRTWVDAFGPLYIGCASTGAQCVLEFTPCGWFSYGRYEFSGWVQDKEGRKHIKLSGKWNQYCDMVPCDAEGGPLEGAESTRLWTCAPKPANDYYSFTHFAHLLNKSDNIRTPLPSDSRRRPDRAALAAGVSSTAGSEKYRLEEMQRAEKRERDRRNDKWQPLWFDPVDAPQLLPGELDVAKVPFWQFNGKFMQARLEGTSGADESGELRDAHIATVHASAGPSIPPGKQREERRAEWKTQRRQRYVKLYAKAARAMLGWSGEEAELFIKLTCGYSLNTDSPELQAAHLDKAHVNDLIEEAAKQRRLLALEEGDSLQDTVLLPCRMRHAVHVCRCLEQWQQPPTPPVPGQPKRGGCRVAAGTSSSNSSPAAAPGAAAVAAHELGMPRIGKGLAQQREFVFNPATQIGVGIDPGVTQAVSAASEVWDPATGQLMADQLRRWKLTKGQVKHGSGLNNARHDTERWLAPIKPHLQHLAAASSTGTSLEANLKHITVYLDPKWAEQRLRLYGAQDRTLEQFFKKLEEQMAELAMQRHGRAKQLVVFFGAASIGTAGGWGADAVLRACCKVVCRPRGTDQRRGRVVLVDEHRTTRVSSSVNGQQPCERQLNKRRHTRPADWKPPAGQVEQRLLRPAWSQQRDQPVRGMMWCPVVAPRKPPQAPRSSQEATQPGASEPGPSTPMPAKRSKRTKAEPEAAEPTKGKGKASKAKPAPQPGRWLDRDCNAALNMQRIGESKWRQLELCWWPQQAALPAKGKEYPGLGYKRLRDKPPQAQQQQPAEAHPVSSAMLTSLLFMPAQVLASLQANNARSEGLNGKPSADSVDRNWLQVIKVPGGAVLRGCKKTRRKLMAHFQVRVGVHSQLRVIASLYVLRIFLTCLVGYCTQDVPTWGWYSSCKYSFNTEPFLIAFITLAAANYCASTGKRRVNSCE